MNAIKYKILITVDNSNEPISYSDLAKTIQQDTDINIFQKHYDDLILQGMMYIPATAYDGYRVSSKGRDYIDRYNEFQLQINMYREEIDTVKQSAKEAKRSALIANITAILALALTVLSLVIKTILPILH